MCVKPLEFTYAWCRRIQTIIKTLLCFGIVNFAWIFFRADGVSQSLTIVRTILSNFLGRAAIRDGLVQAVYQSKTLISSFMPDYTFLWWAYIGIIILAIVTIFIFDFRQKYLNLELDSALATKNVVLRWGLYYYMIILAIFCFVMTTNEYGQAGAFLFFQF